MLTLDPRWVRFAPLTSAGVVIAGAAFGLVPRASTPSSTSRPSTPAGSSGSARPSLVLGGLAAIVVALCVLAVVGYLVTNFGFQLTRSTTDGSWHLRRGLFTTRETSLDDARVSGVSIGEPLSLRLADGARLSAIVTGLSKQAAGSSVLVPPAPRAEVDRVAVEVLGHRSPVTVTLVRHGRSRRTPPVDPRARPGRPPWPPWRSRSRVEPSAWCALLAPLAAGRRSAAWPSTAAARWATPSSTATWWPARAASTAAGRRWPPPR